MPKIEIDVDKLQLAVQLFDYSRKQVEEVLYKFNALNNEFQADMQLQTSLEYPQIQVACEEFSKSCFVVNEKMQDLYSVFLQVPGIYSQLEEKAKNRVEGIVAKAEITQRNMSDITAINIELAVEADEDVSVFAETSQLVQNNSYEMALASTAAAVGIIEETYAGDENLGINPLVEMQVENSVISLEASLVASMEETEDE